MVHNFTISQANVLWGGGIGAIASLFGSLLTCALLHRIIKGMIYNMLIIKIEKNQRFS